jgi:hypothetical protein
VSTQPFSVTPVLTAAKMQRIKDDCAFYREESETASTARSRAQAAAAADAIQAVLDLLYQAEEAGS